MGKWLKYNKYTKRTKDGYRSVSEKKFALSLTSKDISFTYEPKDGKIAYTMNKLYIPDFILKNGIILEFKGYMDADDRRKHIAIIDQHPEIDIRFVLEDSKTSTGLKKRLGEWLTWKGIKWTCCKYGDALEDVLKWSKE